MQKNSEDFSMQEALRLAKSPAGQQLLALLQKQDQAQMEKAARLVSSGDYAQATQALQSLVSSPEIRQLLDQMGGSHGRSGK